MERNYINQFMSFIPPTLLIKFCNALEHFINFFLGKALQIRLSANHFCLCHGIPFCASTVLGP